MKIVTPILLAISMSFFTACSDSSSVDDGSYVIGALEDRDVPIDAQLLAQSTDTEVTIKRDVESDTMNVYVISGSVKVTDQTPQE